jgi:predicted nucleotidyltransferase
MAGTRGRSRSRKGTIEPSILRDVIRRVVEAAQPDKIVLFGSAARGKMRADSDLDLLVIKGGKFNRWRVTTAIYRKLIGADAPVDVVLVTPDEVDRYRHTHCLVICPALKDGRVVYGA